MDSRVSVRSAFYAFCDAKLSQLTVDTGSSKTGLGRTCVDCSKIVVTLHLCVTSYALSLSFFGASGLDSYLITLPLRERNWPSCLHSCSSMMYLSTL